MFKAVDKHGFRMKGLRKAAGETKGLRGYYSGEYVELFYDTSSGEVLTDYQYSLGQNTWTVYHDASVIKICNISDSKSMQDIADLIYDKMREIDCYGW